VVEGTRHPLPFKRKWRAVFIAGLFYFLKTEENMIRKIKIGDETRYFRVITSEDVRKFGELSGDMNKAHFDPEFAKTTVFKTPIVHGMLVGSLFSRIFGTDFIGEGMIYCNQSLKFLKPVYPEMKLEVVAKVIHIDYDKNRVIFSTEIFNEHHECMVTGEAMLMPRKVKD
jgi:acyl dehydratase